MKFKFLLFVSFLSHLSNSASIGNNTSTISYKNMTTNPYLENTTTIPENATVIPTERRLLKILLCYSLDYTLKNLDSKKAYKKMEYKQKTSPRGLVRFNFIAPPYNKMCGLLIYKNHTSNDYEFLYGLFDRDHCLSQTDTICDSGSNCTKMALRCCVKGLC